MCVECRCDLIYTINHLTKQKNAHNEYIHRCINEGFKELYNFSNANVYAKKLNERNLNIESSYDSTCINEEKNLIILSLFRHHHSHNEISFSFFNLTLDCDN